MSLDNFMRHQDKMKALLKKGEKETTYYGKSKSKLLEMAQDESLLPEQ